MRLKSLVPEALFEDRVHAGRQLAAALRAQHGTSNPLVLALPRGGVPVAFEIAQSLNGTLGVVVARKLGVPWEPELGFGAIAGETCVLNRELILELNLTDPEIEEVVARETAEMQRREQLYGATASPYGRDCILVDDGLATGSTMIAAARHIRTAGPRALIIAVPVASTAFRRLRNEADELVCLAMPDPFGGVGKWYSDFHQLNDTEVIEILDRARRGYKHAANNSA